MEKHRSESGQCKNTKLIISLICFFFFLKKSTGCGFGSRILWWGCTCKSRWSRNGSRITYQNIAGDYFIKLWLTSLRPLGRNFIHTATQFVIKNVKQSWNHLYFAEFWLHGRGISFFTTYQKIPIILSPRTCICSKSFSVARLLSGGLIMERCGGGGGWRVIVVCVSNIFFEFILESVAHEKNQVHLSIAHGKTL